MGRQRSNSVSPIIRTKDRTPGESTVASPFTSSRFKRGGKYNEAEDVYAYTRPMTFSNEWAQFLFDNRIMRTDNDWYVAERAGWLADHLDKAYAKFGEQQLFMQLARLHSFEVNQVGDIRALNKTVETTPIDPKGDFYLPNDLHDNYVAYCGSTIIAGVLNFFGIDQFIKGVRPKVGKYDVIVQLDYYAERRKSMDGIHRDSRGNTLFVFLIFIGEDEFTGTEVVEYARRGDRWKTNGAEKMPRYIQSLVHECMPVGKQGPTQRTTTQSKPVTGGTVLGFVDPLVFHATPNPAGSTGGALGGYIAGTGKILDKVVDHRYPSFFGDTNPSTKRRFFRMWVTFEERKN